jgi:ribosomal protein S18 acetylase RimI-like enzyme
MTENKEIIGENIILKRAGVEDIPSILEVEKGLVGTKIYSGLTGTQDAEKEISENIFYVIEKNGKVVGDIAYQMKEDDHVYISGLAIAKEFQGQGIARQAVKMILEQLKDVKKIDLVTHPENDKAIKLYEELGFKKVGEPIENFYGDGEPRIKMLLEK